ncbi:MAG: helix-turn-helix domain-containing protein [Microcella sp.]|uniref:TetR/AcrR family transcriptional regulator n=1 Tax=Microcella sp. TaxID=1913979 RepID=UPI00271AD474|nr:TetR/AcrR family transcriptional regulator [Microcella sp.]MDO8337066.1 helix-turn-helix domain-containing protein [Microcella sp.]
MSRSEDLRLIALAEFASAGYAATSLQRIADLAGASKASVLYHYDSKEQLLEAALAPALDDLSALIDETAARGLDREHRAAFVERFVDYLLDHRQVVHLVINQGATLEDVPVMQRALVQMRRVADLFDLAASSPVEKLRYGIALGGAAYCLAAARQLDVVEEEPEVLRAGLLVVISELLVPVTDPATEPVADPAC